MDTLVEFTTTDRSTKSDKELDGQKVMITNIRDQGTKLIDFWIIRTYHETVSFRWKFF